MFFRNAGIEYFNDSPQVDGDSTEGISYFLYSA